MYLDTFTLSALVDEFLDTLVGARIQDVIDVDDSGIGLEVYSDRKRRYLYLSADNHLPRIQLFDEKLRRGLAKPTQLGLLFRRYVEGGSIAHVSQPPWERIIQFDIHGPEGEVTIIAEPMERRSNLLLTQAGTILDCMRRVGPDENRYRLSLPAHEYKLPPPQLSKFDPTAITFDELAVGFARDNDPKRKTTQVLASSLLGVSPLLAKEIVFRAGGTINQSASDVNLDTLHSVLQQVMAPLSARRWQPGILQPASYVEAYSVYPITYSTGWHPVPTLSSALTAFYGAPIGGGAYRAAKVPVAAALKEAKAKLNAKLASLEKSMTDEKDREVLRHSAELILAYQYTVQLGQTELRAQYEADEPELIVTLDPSRSPLENAQSYFARYDKAKRALEDVPKLIRQTHNDLRFLEQLEIDLEFANSWPEIDEVQQTLQLNGYWQGAPIRKAAGGGQSAPLKVVTPGGYVIWVGRNSRQNELVTFGKGSGQDLWLHARAVPGAHVIVKFDGREIPVLVTEQAASLAAYYSACRADGKVEVDVTRCLYVKKIKGAGQGMVTYRNEKTLIVIPRKESDFVDLSQQEQ